MGLWAVQGTGEFSTWGHSYGGTEKVSISVWLRQEHALTRGVPGREIGRWHWGVPLRHSMIGDIEVGGQGQKAGVLVPGAGSP